jgi:hypothetical protein
MRPASIVYFERLSILSILVGVALILLTWDSDVKVPQDSGMNILAEGIALAILLLLIFLISRRANVIAKWCLTALYVVGVALSSPQLLRAFDQGLIGLLFVSQMIVFGAAVYFLFTPEASIWFKEKKGAGPVF